MVQYYLLHAGTYHGEHTGIVTTLDGYANAVRAFLDDDNSVYIEDGMLTDVSRQPHPNQFGEIPVYVGYKDPWGIQEMVEWMLTPLKLIK